jgi:hypothetical protein
MGVDGTSCMHWFRSLGQNIWINHRKTAVWNRTRKLCIADSVGIINQLLLAALGKKFTCIRLVAIDGEEEHIRSGNSFIDNTTTGSTNDDSELEPVSHDMSELTSSEETLIAKMEEIIHFFLDLLQVT